MQLVIVDPGHFHATLLQKEMYPGLASRVSVYAPLGPDVLDYLNRISLFNSRKEHPTRWEIDAHLSSDPMGEMLRQRPGNIAVFSGRNRGKIDRIQASLSAGMHVLADKPWIISSDEMPKLEQTLDDAARRGLAAYDIMTERYEITSELLRALVNDKEVFGSMQTGSAPSPAIRARSVHHVMKTVAGVPLRRPAWFFDIAEYGEGLADVGTHVVDLVQWTAFPDQSIDYRKDIRMIEGRHWPLTLTTEQFEQITREPAFPPALSAHVRDGKLDYYCNNSVAYTLRGVHVSLEILWNWEASPGAGDVYEASFRGTKATAEIRQGPAEKFVPEVYIVPGGSAPREEVIAAAHKMAARLQARWPGLSAVETQDGIRMVIPEQYRVGHEAHFAQVASHFFNYVKSPASLPAWERAFMLAKYFVSTKGVELGRKSVSAGR